MTRRTLIALALTIVAIGFPGSTLIAQDGGVGGQEQPSLAGGIGNTRADLDSAFGPAEHQFDVLVFSDMTIQNVRYEDRNVFFVLEDDEPSADDRSYEIRWYPEDGGDFTYPEVIDIANALLPIDAVATSDLIRHEITSEEFPDYLEVEYRQSFTSESIARLIPNEAVYRVGAPGDVWLVLPVNLTQTSGTDTFNDVLITLNVQETWYEE